MKVVRYRVRVLNRKGKVITKKTFKVESLALEWARKKFHGKHRVTIAKDVDKVTPFKIRDEWGSTTSRPAAPKPVGIMVVHHSVTKQLSPNASIKQEIAEMKSVQGIGYARDLGGFPYGMAIPPSGRCYRGSGFGVIEAATGGYNTPTDSVVLLGNYDVFKPTPEQIDTLIDLGIWGQGHGFFTKPLTVDPHRKYKATACPGQHVVGELPKVQHGINK